MVDSRRINLSPLVSVDALHLPVLIWTVPDGPAKSLLDLKEIANVVVDYSRESAGYQD